MAFKGQFDFGGYATKINLKCKDGRTIKHGAFKGNDGQTVPLVWQHLHNVPTNVLGHAILEHRADGVYCYGVFNDSESGRAAKSVVQHGDVKALSIFANELNQNGSHVLDGNIREVSLVFVGSNPGAYIEPLSIAHGDDGYVDSDEEAFICMGLAPMSVKSQQQLEHAADASSGGGDRTVQEIWDGLDQDEKDVVAIIISQAVDGNTSMKQSALEEGDETFMKHNVWDQTGGQDDGVYVSPEQFAVILKDAGKPNSSFKTSFLAHAGEYGIDDIEFFLPDARTVGDTPTLIKRRTEWVSSIIDGTKHTPFSRIKTLFADITADSARAKGYAVKGAVKVEEVIKALKRVTTPTTVYKKQKLDHDDVIDITDFDVVAFLKAEMRIMLDEEVARAILISDGRLISDPDKIAEDHLRPIYKEADLFVHRVVLATDADTFALIDAIIESRTEYEGTGNPVLFTTPAILTRMLLLKDTTKRRIYATQAELEAALRVSKIIEVPVMSGISREDDDDEDVTLNLIAILVNPKDYTIGADKGGQLGLFDDFDIDVNQHKYLMETRISGCLTMPKSAIIIEQIADAG